MLKKIKELKFNKKAVLIIFGLLFFIIIDQITKVIFAKNIMLIPNVLKFSYVENTGGAFGFLSDNLIIVIILNIVLLGMIIRFFIMYKDRIRKLMEISLLLIIAGGTSNVLDRIFKGHVVDFIDVRQLINFPVFNLADITLIIGWLLFIICVIMDLRGEKRGVQSKRGTK